MSFFSFSKKSAPDIEKMTRERDVNGLIKALEYTESEDIQTAAAEALKELGPSVLAPLVAFLRKTSDELIQTKPPDPEKKKVLHASIAVLRSIGDPAIATLRGQLGIADVPVRENAERALIWIGKPAVDKVIPILKYPNPAKRASAAFVLGGIGDPRAVEPLLQMLRDPDREVQTQVALALGQIGDLRAIEPLIRLCRRGKWEDSLGVPIAALSRIGAPVIWPCIHALGHSNEYVRLSAKVVLGQLEDISVAPLHIALNHPDDGVRNHIPEVLASISNTWRERGDAIAARYTGERNFDAVKCYDRAIAIDPTNTLAMNNEAVYVSPATGVTTWAGPAMFDCMRKAIQIEPENPVFQRNYAHALSKLLLVEQAQILQNDGDLDNAMRLWKEREKDCRYVENHDGVQDALGNQGVILHIRGDLDGAMALLKEQERISRELGSHHGIQSSLGNQAMILRQRGDQEGAAALFREQERICRETENTESLQQSFSEKGKRLVMAGDTEGALALFREQERICQEFGYSDGLIQSLDNQTSILEARGDLNGALYLRAKQIASYARFDNIQDLLRILNHQEKLCRDLGDDASLYRSLWEQALILLFVGDLQGAETILKKEEQLRRKLSKTDDLLDSLVTRARILMIRGDRDGAMNLVKEIEQIVSEPEKIRRLTAALDDPEVVGDWRYRSSELLEKVPDGMKGERDYSCSQCGKPIPPGFSYDFESYVLEAAAVGSHCSECGDIRCVDHGGDGSCQQCGGRTYRMRDTPPDMDPVRLYLYHAVNIRTGEITSEHYNGVIRPPTERAS